MNSVNMLINNIKENKKQLKEALFKQKTQLKSKSSFIYKVIGEQIKINRTSKHLSQEDLALMVGLERTSIIGIEKGKQRISVDKLYTISKIIGMSLPWLFDKVLEQEPVEVEK